MRAVRIAIVGAGLAGLYAAYLLENQGIHDYVLIEAREAPGGRIASVAVPPPQTQTNTAAAPDRFDLGPTWFWPEIQSELDHLIRDLGLQRFAQFEHGDMLLERTIHEPPSRARGYASAPTSMRLIGGMQALIDALRSRLDNERIVTGHSMQRMRVAGSQIELDSIDAAGHNRVWRAEHVLLAIPPRLAASTIDFVPALPPALAQRWRATATWMAPHAKYIAAYDTPFWREHGLSGSARSAHGPLGEIHDASIPGARAALFGFFAVPARIRYDVPEASLRAHCRAQLARLFGPEAATPVAEAIKDWAYDPHTATAADRDNPGRHAEAPPTVAESGPWTGRLAGIASEWSPPFPGYLAGAIDAARRGVHTLLDTIEARRLAAPTERKPRP